MARYSWAEGMKIAETEAWRTKGKRHSSMFVYGRFIPWVIAAVVLGALGYGVKWAWDRMGAAFTASTDTAPGAVAHSGIPSWTWMAGIVLLIVTVLAVRGRSDHPRRFSTMLAVVAGAVIAWLGFLAFVIGAL
jgi:hypothetical protein